MSSMRMSGGRESFVSAPTAAALDIMPSPPAAGSRAAREGASAARTRYAARPLPGLPCVGESVARAARVAHHDPPKPGEARIVGKPRNEHLVAFRQAGDDLDARFIVQTDLDGDKHGV